MDYIVILTTVGELRIIPRKKTQYYFRIVLSCSALVPTPTLDEGTQKLTVVAIVSNSFTLASNKNDLEETLSVAERREVSGSGLLGKSLSSNNLVRNSSGNGHHGGTAVVQLSILLTKLLGGLGIPVVQCSKTDTIVSIELSSGPPGKLYETADNKDLEKSGWGDLEETSDASADVTELEIGRRGKVSVESPVVVVDEGSGHSHHGNTSVLALDGTVADELILVSDVSKGIEVSKRGHGSDLGLLESVQGS